MKWNNLKELTVGFENLAENTIPVYSSEQIPHIEPLSPTDANVSTEVNEEGEPIPNNINNFILEPLLNVHEYVPCDIIAITSDLKESQKAVPYCPVYTSVNADGKLMATAYVTGTIKDLPLYADLLDVLEIMEEGDTMIIYVDSPGGFVVTGAAIASCIASCKGTTIGVARGLCASAGSLVWSACDKCIADPFATFMYHMSSHIDMGNSEAIRERAALQVMYVRDCLLNTARNKGHITADEMELIVHGKKDVFIPASEMLKRLQSVA